MGRRLKGEPLVLRRREQLIRALPVILCLLQYKPVVIMRFRAIGIQLERFQKRSPGLFEIIQRMADLSPLHVSLKERALRLDGPVKKLERGLLRTPVLEYGGQSITGTGVFIIKRQDYPELLLGLSHVSKLQIHLRDFPVYLRCLL